MRTIAIFVMLALMALSFIWLKLPSVPPSPFYGDALRKEQIATTVRIGWQNYEVDGDVVRRRDGTVPSEQESQEAMRLAYAQALAIRSPLFGLDGTDPERLRSAIDALDKIRTEYADMQQNPEDSDRIRTSLYPLSFLRSLAELERKRQAFITSGTASDERAYRRAIVSTVVAHETDLKKFENSFRFYVGNMQTLSSLITKIPLKSVELAFEQMYNGLSELKEQVRNRTNCIDGNSSSCLENDLGVRVPDVVTAPDSNESRAISRAETILSIYEEAGDPHRAGWVTVELSTDDCIASFPAPYLFSVTDPENNLVPINPFLYLGDLYSPNWRTGKESLLRQLGINIPSDYMNPVAYYRCPDKGEDIARAVASVLTARFAAAHPNIAPALRAPLMGSLVREYDAVTYLRATLPALSGYAPIEQARLIALSLMFRHKGAGFDILLHEMANVERGTISRQADDRSTAQNARFLFLSSSALASSFQMYNPSAGGAPLALYQIMSPQEIAKRLHGLLSDSSLNRSDIVQSIRVHVLYEKGGYNEQIKKK